METIKLFLELIITAIKDTPWWAWILLILFIVTRAYHNRTVWGGKYLWIPPFLKRKSQKDKNN